MYSPKRLPESLCQVIPAWLHAMESLTMFMKMTAAWRTDSCRSTDLEDEESHHDWRGWQPWWQGTWGRTAAKPTIMQTNYSFFLAPFLTEFWPIVHPHYRKCTSEITRELQRHTGPPAPPLPSSAPWSHHYMVRNHQDGYPYLNLALFIFLKISRDLNFFCKNDWSMNSGRRRAGDS